MSSNTAIVNALSDRLNAHGFLDEEVEILLGEDFANLTRNGGAITPLPWDGAGFTADDTATIDLTLSAGNVLTAVFIGDTDDVPEGANLYFTAARADARIAAASINDLSDVAAGAATNGQFLGFDGTSWIGADAPADYISSVGNTATIAHGVSAGGELTSTVQVDPAGANLLEATVLGLLVTAELGDLTNVDLTGATAGQVLGFDGTSWVPVAPAQFGEYVGGHDASGGFPTSTNQGDWYRVTVAGNGLEVGDIIVANTDGASAAGDYDVVDNGAAPVTSVNGQVGVVSLAMNDLSDVDTAGITNGQVLAWNGTGFAPADDTSYIVSESDTATIGLATDPAGNLTANFVGNSDDITEGATNLYFTNARADARIALANIQDLANVSSAIAPANGDVLQWNGASWANAAIPAAHVVSHSDGSTVDIEVDGAGDLTAEVIIDPASTAIALTTPAGLLLTEAPLTLTTDGNATGVTQSGLAGHTANIRLLSGNAGQVASLGTDGGVLVEGGQVFEDLAVSTTTSATMQSKIAATAAAVAGGLYKITVSYGWNHNAANSDFEAEFLFNGAALDAFAPMHKQEPKDAGGNTAGTGTSQGYAFTKVYTTTLAAGATPAIALNYRTDLAGVNSSIWDSKVILEKIG